MHVQPGAGHESEAIAMAGTYFAAGRGQALQLFALTIGHCVNTGILYRRSSIITSSMFMKNLYKEYL